MDGKSLLSSKSSDNTRSSGYGARSFGGWITVPLKHLPHDGELLLVLGCVAIQALAVARADHHVRAARSADGPEFGRLGKHGDRARGNRDARSHGARHADGRGGKDTRGQ
jgi:hypothetical protein